MRRAERTPSQAGSAEPPTRSAPGQPAPPVLRRHGEPQRATQNDLSGTPLHDTQQALIADQIGGSASAARASTLAQRPSALTWKSRISMRY